MTPAEFNQQRAWLAELLASPHLWPWQVAQVQVLAEKLGIEVVIMDKPLSWNGGDWKRRGDHGQE